MIGRLQDDDAVYHCLFLKSLSSMVVYTNTSVAKGRSLSCYVRMKFQLVHTGINAHMAEL